jgi:glutaminyl-peptide cyclotransferase
MRRMLLFLAFIVAALPLRVRADFIDFARANAIPVYEVDVQSELPHNVTNFTQGLLIYDGMLYESTGLYGQSKLLKLDPATGQTIQSVALDPDLFGEGIAVGNGELVQLTWQERTALIWTPSDLTRTKTFAYNTEGWGLTSDDRRFFQSDGSPWLYRRSLADFSLIDSVAVTLAGRRVNLLNELEYVNGKIYANFLGADFIAEINPESGVITAIIDAASLRDRIRKNPMETPLNGIAYDPQSQEYLLTGKLWPKIFRVKFITGFGR